jgi:acetyltransferase-like isoleucine patch superfamily enzyme
MAAPHAMPSIGRSIRDFFTAPLPRPPRLRDHHPAGAGRFGEPLPSQPMSRVQVLGQRLRRFILRHRPSFRSLKRGRARDLFEFGRGTYGEPTVQFPNAATLRVGAFCSIADNVQIFLGGNHRTDWITTYPFSAFRPDARRFAGMPQTKGDIVIGNDVWIGDGATILSGVTIGDGAVIGARAVIAKDVPPYAVMIGNPARLLRRRFTEPQIEQLLRLAWWNWPDAKIDRAMPHLMAGDVEALVAFAQRDQGDS